MSDSAQIPSPPVSSYVDSYVPPGMTSSVVSSNPVVKQDAISAVDPLKQLEELVQEYELKKVQKEKEDISALKDLESLAAQSGKKKSEAGTGEQKDPLAELEKVLEEYEKKYQEQAQKQSQASVQSQPAQQPLSVSSTASSSQPLATAMSQTVSSDSGMAKMDSEESNFETEKVSEPGEAIDEQNIFELLGVKTASDSEKETFLDELQQALWEDFLDKDLPLLVTEKELAEIRAVQNDTSLAEDKKQNALIEKIEKLVPDIEDIMLEKALELKEDMVWERVKGLKEHFAGKSDALTTITQAETHLKAGRWKAGTDLLNGLSQ